MTRRARVRCCTEDSSCHFRFLTNHSNQSDAQPKSLIRTPHVYFSVPVRKHFIVLANHIIIMKASKVALSALRSLALSSSPAPCYPSTSKVFLADIQIARRAIAQAIRIRKHTLRRTNPALPVLRRHSSTKGLDDPKSNATSPEGALSKTSLHDLHLKYGGKMVPFAGFSMPVQYRDLSVGESHQWTRENCSLFDVGHMYVFAHHCQSKRPHTDSPYRVQHHISGPGAATFLETITPTSIASLKQNRSTLSCLLLPYTGGIVDDTVITRLGPELFYLVTNAACKKKDLAYLEEQILNRNTSHGPVEWVVREGWGLIALQGPLSAEVLEAALTRLGVEDAGLVELYFGQCKSVDIRSLDGGGSARVLVSRGGYTGEDGFEISIPARLTQKFTEFVLEVGGEQRVRLAGLGARDSLRLEAGMCLYGHDLDDKTTPVEAGLSWVVHKDRRTTGGFHGHETILRQLLPAKEGGGVERRRVGLIVEGSPAREGAEVVAEDGQVLGKVTSGCPSPTLGKNISMGYVKHEMHKAGTEVGVLVRGKRRKATVVKMPFVPSRYWKGAAPG